MAASLILNQFSRSLSLTRLVLIALGLAFAAYIGLEKHLDRVHQDRFISHLLVDELRQSSEELTRLVRTYVVTGDPSYQRQFEAILEIRDGRRARSHEQAHGHWALLPEHLPRAHRPGLDAGIPLLDLMRQHGFTRAELEQMTLVKERSDRLALVEREAMRLATAPGPDAAEQRARALDLVFGEDYHQAKKGILIPIDVLYRKLDRRTRDEVMMAERAAYTLLGVVLVFAVWVLVLLGRTRRALGETLGGRIQEVYTQIERLGRGDFSASPQAATGPPDSVLGWLAETRARLNESDRQRRGIEERLRTTQAGVDAAADEIFWVTMDSRIIEINPAVCRALGYTREEMLELSIADINPLLTPRLWEKHVAELREQGSLHFEATHRTKDGRIMPVEIVANLIRFDSDERICAIARDLTDHRLMERTLRISEARHRLLADNARDVIWTLAIDGTITYVSPAVEQVLGFTPAEAMSLSLDEILTPDSFREAQAYLSRLHVDIEAGRSPSDFHGEQEYHRKDGSILWADVRAYPITAADGSFIELLGVTRDISERKQYERELEAARRAAEDAACARSQFLANMSHEIRTPMNGVLGLAQLLEREPLTPDQLAMVRSIRASGRTLLGIINDILDLSKIEAGQLRIAPSPFDLASLLRHLDSLLGSAARAKGLTLRITAPASLSGRLLGDVLRLEQILMNLLGNAIKFTAQGQVSLEVETLALSPREARLRFLVADTGIGIAPEVRSTLFTPFTQADGSITRRFGGTGLGLSISRRLVELMGGCIGVDSTPGVGSRFWIELAFARTTEPVSAAARSAETVGANRARLRGLRVLVAEDSDINREVIQRILEREGADVTMVDDGQQAVDRLRAAPVGFDAVLMDIQMPILDGLAATAEIRGALALTQLPIIACSAGVLDTERKQALEAGANDFLPKPLDLEQLVKMLQRWFDPAPPATQSTGATLLSDHPPDRIMTTTPTQAHQADLDAASASMQPATGEPGHARFDAASASTQPATGEPVHARLDMASASARPAPGEPVHAVHAAHSRLDAVSALALLGGDERLYRRILGRFVTDFADLRVTEETTETKRQVHTVKGISLNIGATRLHQLALALEHDWTPERLTEFQVELDAVTDEIRQSKPPAAT